MFVFSLNPSKKPTGQRTQNKEKPQPWPSCDFLEGKLWSPACSFSLWY